MKKRAYTFALALLVALPASSADLFPGRSPVFSAAPQTAGGRARNRAPASAELQARAKENRQLFEKMKPGDRLLIQNSVPDLEDRIVTLVDKFEDGSVRVRLPNGRVLFVRAVNLAATLSPEVRCGDSAGTQICRGDQVFYPARTTSLDLPETKVQAVFANGRVSLREGEDYVFRLNEVGKAVECSPQRPAICVGTYAHAQGYRGDEPFAFEGPVERVYSHGVAVVKSDKLWRFPIQVEGLRRRVDSLDGARDPSVISGRGTRSKNDLPLPVTEEIEPLNTNLPASNGEADRGAPAGSAR